MNSDIFLKIRSEDLANKVYNRLKIAITTQIIKPGERIDINGLAQQWEVSRTPIKDAIARLSNEGLIIVKPKIGTYVTQFSNIDMLELIQIRLLIEGGVARDIIEHVTDEKLAELEMNLSLMEEELAKDERDHDFFTFNDLDANFHELLVEISGNSQLLKIYRSLNFHTQVARFYFNRYSERFEMNREDHKNIVDSIKNKDVERLEMVMKKHILSGKDKLLE
ncbi:GntR family transcriptional regulator [Bacillus sp. sid0103]|uniref:GntR family transcriptional regulator n=1 Tax=Bacillus sp. sid0103 TaxID=2856337 RepID=UPI001C4901BB|nr:GntR family transcriptional regulator [Bacillus sp. sid0103]MBV7504372.1 GntR family transcriptional regulator [Bacillus sp. sid0103]